MLELVCGIISRSCPVLDAFLIFSMSTNILLHVTNNVNISSLAPSIIAKHCKRLQIEVWTASIRRVWFGNNPQFAQTNQLQHPRNPSSHIASHMSKLIITTSLGNIRLLFNQRTPETVQHVHRLVLEGKLSNAKFYRSDFVIQFGVHGVPNADRPPLQFNESRNCGMSNNRGTAAFAHWDVPDCGNTEMFINLGNNPHLDAAYGGFCVFASVDASDNESFATMDKIAAKVIADKALPITEIRIE